MYETVDKFGYIATDKFGNKTYTEDGVRFASLIMDTINEQKDIYNFDYSVSVEAVPAERCAAILYAKDKLLYPNSPERIMYGNQWIPLDQKCTLDEKIKLGAILDKKCGGGQILHANLKGDFANEEQAWNLLNHIAASGVIYFAYNKKISICKNGHGFIGNICPHCGEPVEDTYQRIVGFLTPSKSYSKERKIEFAKRYWYDLDD
jgi:ribonucleoside-triphosphate reductase